MTELVIYTEEELVKKYERETGLKRGCQINNISMTVQEFNELDLILSNRLLSLKDTTDYETAKERTIVRNLITHLHDMGCLSWIRSEMRPW